MSTTPATSDISDAVDTTDGDGKDALLPPSKLTLVITMSMGNCPKYLHVRELIREEPPPLAPEIKVGIYHY